MHFFTPLLFLTATTSSALAHPSRSFGHSTHAHLHKRQTGGLSNGQTPSRLEISEIVANRPDQYVLLILAMSEFESRSADDSLSYWQISGIHGVPSVNYDGVEACADCGDAAGYCTHDSIHFPAWHRAYLALFEQEFLNAVNEVANRFPEGSRRTDMLAAAASMRLPYWDWAARADSNSNVFPSVLSSPSVTVDGPNGEQTIANPFFQYTLPETSDMLYQPFTQWPNTLRYPTSDLVNAVSNEASGVNAFTNLQGSMQESVYNLLTVCDDYPSFSNDRADNVSPNCPSSLEGIHNTIHTTAGGPGGNGISGGHMTYLPLASFDPLFWLHHANVDRIFALWQTVHPDSYGGSQVAAHNTWTIQAGSTQNADSPLTPFRQSSGSFWTTNSVRDWAATFDYTYPEFLAGDGSRQSVINYVNSLYGASPSLTASSLSSRVQRESAASAALNSTISLSTSSSTAQPSDASTASVVASATVSVAVTSTLLPNVENIIEQKVSDIKTMLGEAADFVSDLTSPITRPLQGSPAKRALEVNADVSVEGPDSVSATVTSLTTGSQPQYVCNIQTPRYTLNGSYAIYVFTGEPSTQDTTQWLGDDNCVGTIGVLAGGEMVPELLIAGSVPMTRHLQVKVDSGDLQSLNEEHVSPYLELNLNWRIVQHGAEINPDDVSGFKAALYAGSSTPATDDTLPQWSPMTPQIECTKGKAGGIQSIEEAEKVWKPQGAPQTPPQYVAPTTTSIIVIKTVTTECAESSTASVPVSSPAEFAPVESAPSAPASYPTEVAPVQPAPSAPASYPTEVAPVQPAPSAPVVKPSEALPVPSAPTVPTYFPKPYPTEPVYNPYMPTGTAAPSAYGTSWVPSPSDSLTPYTGAGAKISANSVVGLLICALAAMTLL